MYAIRSYYVACLIVVTALVGYPNLNTINGYTRQNDWKVIEPCIVIGCKKVGKQKVTVCIILICRYLKFVGCSPSLQVHGFGLRLLLREYGSDRQFSKLHFGFEPEQTLTTANQRSVKWQADITSLNFFDDIVLFSIKVKSYNFV